jgi:hypothetical protein
MSHGMFNNESHQNVPSAVIIVTNIKDRLYAIGGEGAIPYKMMLGRKNMPFCPSPSTGRPMPIWVDHMGNCRE